MATLNEHLRQAIEGGNAELVAVVVGRMVRPQIRGVAIAHTEDAAVALQREGQLRTGIRHDAPLGVLYLDRHHTDVSSVGSDGLAVGLHHYLIGWLGGLNGLGHDALAVLIAGGHHLTGLVDGFPLQVSVLRHLLAAQFLAVHREFHLVAVAVGPDFHLLALVSLQVPMREDVQHGLVGPPRLQVPRLVFGESAVVENAKLRVVGGIAERVGLATVVEARPEEQASRPGPVGIELPAALYAVHRAILIGGQVHRAHVALVVGRVEIPATCAAARGLLRTDDLPRGVAFLSVVHIVLSDIVEAHHVEAFDHLAAAGIGDGRLSGGVDQPGILSHGRSDAGALNGILHAPLLVAVAPEDDAGVVAVAAYHTLQQSQVLVVDTRQAVLVDDEYALTVADVEQGRRHGVVGGTIGVAAQLFQPFDAPGLQGIGDGRPHTGMVLVHVDTLQFQRLAVQHEAAVGIEAGFAQSGGCLVDIGQLSIHQYPCLHLI